MKKRQLTIKLILCFLVLIIIVLFYSMTVPHKIKDTNLDDKNALLNVFAGSNMLISLAPSFLAIAYALILFYILQDNPNRQLIMVVNAIVIMTLSVAAAMFVFFNTTYFTIPLITTFTRTMITIGLLNIILSFAFKIFKHC